VIFFQSTHKNNSSGKILSDHKTISLSSSLGEKMLCDCITIAFPSSLGEKMLGNHLGNFFHSTQKKIKKESNWVEKNLGGH
jgi:hypothetical protein